MMYLLVEPGWYELQQLLCIEYGAGFTADSQKMRNFQGRRFLLHGGRKAWRDLVIA
jgi:hypothetical protein